MGSLCSVSRRGGHALGEAQAQAYLFDPKKPTQQRLITTSMPPPWITEKVTRQRMKEINGEKSFTTVQLYEEARAALIERESRQAFDSHAKASASALERRANAIVAGIRETDKNVTYANERDKHNQARKVADHFLGNLDIIEKTELLKVARRMPKGAHLHCHFNSCLRPEFLIRMARDRKSMYIRSTCPLTSAEARDEASISFSVLPPQDDSKVDIFSPRYQPLDWMSYPRFCEEFGGVEAAEQWLISKMTLTEEEVHDVRQTGAKWVT